MWAAIRYGLVEPPSWKQLQRMPKRRFDTWMRLESEARRQSSDGGNVDVGQIANDFEEQARNRW